MYLGGNVLRYHTPLESRLAQCYSAQWNWFEHERDPYHVLLRSRVITILLHFRLLLRKREKSDVVVVGLKSWPVIDLTAIDSSSTFEPCLIFLLQLLNIEDACPVKLLFYS